MPNADGRTRARPCAARSGVATLLLPKDAANWSADEPERVMPCIGLWLLGGGAAAAPMSRKRTSLERAGDSDAQLDSSAPLSQEKRPRVALLSVHFEGNLGDEYETTPLLQRLSDWGAEVDAYSDPWLDPTDQSIAHTRTRELKFVNTFYTSDQWLTDSESLLSSDPPTLPGGLYDILIIAPGPGSPPLRLSSILKLAESTETPLAMVGVSMPGGEYPFERDRYRHGYDPLRLVILREPVSFAIAAPELGFNNLSTTERDPITDVTDGHVRVMMSGDTSWSFAPRDSELRAWQGTYSKEFSARFGDTEPWYVLFLRYPDHLLEGTNSTHLVVKDIDGSTMVVPIARSILANDDQSARGDAETHEEMQSRFKLAPDQLISLESVEQMLGLVGCMGPSSNLVVISDRYHPAQAAARMGATIKLMSNAPVHNMFDGRIRGADSPESIKMFGAHQMFTNYSSAEIMALNDAAWSALELEVQVAKRHLR